MLQKPIDNRPNSSTYDVHRCACGHSETQCGGAIDPTDRPHALAELTTQLDNLHNNLNNIRATIKSLGDEDETLNVIADAFDFRLLAPARKLRDHLGLGYPFETIDQIDGFMEYQAQHPSFMDTLRMTLPVVTDPSHIDPTLDAIHSVIEAADIWISDKTDINRVALCLFRVLTAAGKAGYKPSEVLNKMRVLRTGGKEGNAI